MRHGVWIRYRGLRMQVRTDYSSTFRTRAIELGGRWRVRSGMWSFPLAAKRLVLALITELYGEEEDV